jgi:GNAT superfamily N-acetyltransferase
MTIGELSRIAEIDRSEEIVQQYRQRGDALEIVRVDVRADTTVAHRDEAWRAMVHTCAALLGAIEDHRLIGVAIYDRSQADEPAQLAALYVSRAHRRTGVGRALTAEVERRARAGGARRLYVSATPTRATVDFYLGYGFRPLAEPNARLLAKEPEDVHMALALDP